MDVETHQNFKKMLIIFFTSLPSVQNLFFSSDLLDPWFQEIWCQSSIKFDRLRPFLVFHRVFVIFFAAPEFVLVRPILNPTIPSRRAEVVSPRILLVFLLSQNYSLAASAPTRISPQRLMPAGAIRNPFQDVKDQIFVVRF